MHRPERVGKGPSVLGQRIEMRRALEREGGLGVFLLCELDATTREEGCRIVGHELERRGDHPLSIDESPTLQLVRAETRIRPGHRFAIAWARRLDRGPH